MKALSLEAPEQLRDELVLLFPSFKEDLSIAGEQFSFHELLMDFTPYFGRHAHEFSERQLKGLANVIDMAARSPGLLGNAFDTCFFEALRRGTPLMTLKPFLSAEAKTLLKGTR